MTKKVWFTAQSLAPVLDDVKKNSCQLWFLVDEGIYLTAEKASFVRGKRNIAYAVGFDPYESDDTETFFSAIFAAIGSEEIWDSVTLPPDVLDTVTAGSADLRVDAGENGFVFAVKARDEEVNHAE
ncbi:DUF3085 domain-containing protein [Rahnella victoriana]|uniref:DUF3085 domain-containing protein n=1 Tax=Rahnella victoriana TaxID=1510570 RepID=UPI001E567B91|nr:DUF3085 domain-containing protein [Rahnella victoriana]UHM93588.1 DUF3085 domain-containing protein [Rahnella victoriana]